MDHEMLISMVNNITDKNLESIFFFPIFIVLTSVPIISDLDFSCCPLTNLLGVPFSCFGGEKGIDTYSLIKFSRYLENCVAFPFTHPTQLRTSTLKKMFLQLIYVLKSTRKLSRETDRGERERRREKELDAANPDPVGLQSIQAFKV